MAQKILEWTCKVCGKKLKSLYQKQIDFLIKQHELSHEVKDDINK